LGATVAKQSARAHRVAVDNLLWLCRNSVTPGRMGAFDD
jgi:hypothetical protein